MPIGKNTATRQGGAGASLRRLTLLLVTALTIAGSVDPVSASCTRFSTADNGDGTCTTCYYAGDFVENGVRFCVYDCQVEKCYGA